MSLRVSIVVPSFNQADYLSRTLDSIFSQSHPPHEVIVMDGASSDNTVAVLKDYAKYHANLVWQSEPDNGPADAVNKGLERVTGDIIGIQSSDDIYYPDAFAAAVGAFSTAPELGMLYGDLHNIDEHDAIVSTRRFVSFSWDAMFAQSCCLAQSSIFFRSDLARKVGGWNGAYYSCDLDYWLRLACAAPVQHLPVVLSGWRRYEGQRTRPDQFLKLWDGYKKSVDAMLEQGEFTAKFRRQAEASKWLIALRMTSGLPRWQVSAAAVRGAWLHPTFWRYNPSRIIFNMFPLGGRIWAVLARLGVLAGDKPRAESERISG